MPLLNYLLQISACAKPEVNGFVQKLTAFAPVLSFFAAIANVCLAIVVFRYTRRKNDNDVKIKWFQELIFTPNKEALFAFFINLHTLKEKIPADGVLTEDIRIEIMEFIKTERNKIVISFVDSIKLVSTPLHNQIKTAIDGLTDDLTKALDNDELKLENDKTYTREITNKIAAQKNIVISSLFNYRG